jgi:hypothetical protein
MSRDTRVLFEPMNPPPNYGYGAPPPQYYPPPPQQPPVRSIQDVQHLNLLAVFHFIYGAFIAFVGLIFAVYIVFGIFLATSAVPTGSGSGGPPPEAIGGLIAVIGVIAMLFTWGKAALVVWSGFSLRAHRRATLSLVVAFLCCLNVPFGTALGVFTIMVLSRASVKALYQEAEFAHA